jgi:hypothetical protein
MAHVVLLLKGNVDDRLRDILANPIEELGLTDDDLKLGGEVDLVRPVLGLRVLLLSEDRPLQEFDGVVSVVLVPVIEHLVLVLDIELLGKRDVLQGYLFADIRLQQTILSLKLVDGSLDASHDGAGPGDGSRLGWHVFGDRRAFLASLEELLHLGDLVAVTIEDVDVLVTQLVFDGLSSLDVFELVE